MKTEGTPTGLANTLSLEKVGNDEKDGDDYHKKGQGKHIPRYVEPRILTKDLQDKKFL